MTEFDAPSLEPVIRIPSFAPPPIIPVTESLRTFPESFYRSPKEMAASIVQSIKEEPDKKYILTGGGRPIMGSSTIMDEIVTYIGWALSDFVRERNYHFRPAVSEWGHACVPIEHAGDPPLNVDPTHFRKLHIAEGAKIYYDTLRLWLTDVTPKTINLWASTQTLNAGLELDGEEIGLPRAFKDMEELAKRSGRFAGFDYEDFWFSTDSSPQVEDHNTLERVEMLRRPPGIERERFLESIGKKIRRPSGVKMLPYGAGVASKANKDEIDGQIDDTIMDLKSRGLIPTQPELSWRFRTREDLLNRLLRSHIIIRALNPFIFDSLGIRRDKTAHFYNHQIQREVTIYRDVEVLNPLVVYNPRLYEPFLQVA